MTENRISTAIQTNTRRRHFTVLLLWLLVIAVSSASATQKHGKMKPWLVEAVHFTGNASVSSSDLLGIMDTKPSRLYHRTKFSPSLVNADINAIIYLYREKGFLDAQVTAGDILKDPLSRRVTVNIFIEEGPETRIDSITIEGHTVLGEAEILRSIRAKPLAPYSAAGLSDDQQAIHDSIAARGFPLCAVNRIDSVDSIAHRASVTFLIDQGPLVKAGAMVVNGTKGLREIIVKRGLTFRLGDTLTTRQIQMSERQLYETGMFKYVQITTPVADSAKARQITGPLSLPVFITIEEADFYRVQGGVGYGTYEGVRLSLSTSYGNVLGLGRTLGLDGKYSGLVQSLHLHYTVPWFFLLPPTAKAEVYGERHKEVTFTGNLEGLRLSLFAKTSWNFGFRVFTYFEWVNGVVVQPQALTPAPLIHANNTQSFGTGLTYDTRNNVFDPAKGALAISDAELAGLVGAGTNHFYRLVADLRWYLPITHFLNSASAVTAGYVSGYGVDKTVLPPQELLYAGSERIRSVRGYAPGGVGDAVGGRLALILNVIELRLTIAKWLKLAGFADAGFVWSSTSLFTVEDLLWTAGPGLRFRTPIGLLSTDMGIRLNGPTMGETGFSVSIGQPF